MTDMWTCTAAIAEDLSGDCQVNLADFKVLADQWVGISSGDGYGLDDLVELAMAWLNCNRAPSTLCGL
jgi:hypothetical protein